MKRSKEQPSVLGLLLVVAGMILLSTLLIILLRSRSISPDNGPVLIGVACAAVLALAAGSVLSARGKK